MADPDPVTLKQLSAPQEAVLPDREFAKRFPWYKPVDYFIKGLEENRQGRGQVFDRGDDQAGPGGVARQRNMPGALRLLTNPFHCLTIGSRNDSRKTLDGRGKVGRFFAI